MIMIAKKRLILWPLIVAVSISLVASKDANDSVTRLRSIGMGAFLDVFLLLWSIGYEPLLGRFVSAFSICTGVVFVGRDLSLPKAPTIVLGISVFILVFVLDWSCRRIFFRDHL